jgi:hypothetical protein
MAFNMLTPLMRVINPFGRPPGLFDGLPANPWVLFALLIVSKLA